MSGWQPIETAPALSPAFLVLGRHPDGSPWWSMGWSVGKHIGGDWAGENKPTHWMPLPDPPAA